MKYSLLVLLLAFAVPAAAESKTGSVKGTVKQKPGNITLAGVTVVFESPVLSGEQVVLTDEKGAFVQSNLPPGTYKITYYYADITTKHENVVVKGGATVTVNDTIKVKPGQGDVIEIRSTPVEPFTLTGPDFTLEFTDDLAITLKRGKTVTKAMLQGSSVALADGSVVDVKADGDNYTIEIGGKLIGKMTAKFELVLGKRKLSFNKKGELVGGKQKIKITPAKLGSQPDPMIMLAALLRDQI